MMMSHTKDWPDPEPERVYDPVWECIYCGAEPDNLGKEHIVPRGLGGTLILPRACCSDHDQRFEGIVLRGPMWNVRSLRKIPSRNPEKMPSETEVVVVRDGEEQEKVLPLEDAPVLLHLPRFAPPSHLTGSNSDGAIDISGIFTIGYGRAPDDLATEYAEEDGADKVEITQQYRPVAFARMIGKIGYSYAVAELGLDAFSETYPVPDILGERDRIGRWVGLHPGKPPAPRGGGLHRLALGRHEGTDAVVVDVQLLSDGQTPTYLVVVGELS